MFQEVFGSHRLPEPPWRCWSVRKGAPKEDVGFGIERRALKKARRSLSSTGARVRSEVDVQA